MFLSVIMSQATMAQKMPGDYFDDGEAFMETKEFDSAILSFRHIISNNPSNYLYAEAFYNTGYAFYQMNQYDSSILILKTILYNFIPDPESRFHYFYTPCTCYMQKAGLLLSDNYDKKEMYDTALFYLALSDTTYPSGCWEENEANKIQNAIKYASLYHKLKNNDKELESLLNAVLLDEGNNAEIIRFLKPLLRKKKNPNFCSRIA